MIATILYYFITTVHCLVLLGVCKTFQLCIQSLVFIKVLGTFALTSRSQKEEITKYKQLKKILVFINSSDVLTLTGLHKFIRCININFDE